MPKLLENIWEMYQFSQKILSSLNCFSENNKKSACQSNFHLKHIKIENSYI